MDTDTTNDATRFCRLLARALRRRLQPADGFGRLPEARHGPSSEEAARCVVRAAGASGCGGLFDREALPCSVGAEDGAIYRMWRWLSVAWPLNILLYVLTLPLAELQQSDLVSSEDTGLFAKTAPASLGKVTGFVSHSWQDDGVAKYKQLEAEAAQLREE